MLATIAGCTPTRQGAADSAAAPPARPSQVPPSNAANLDPCAVRLHDVAGALLLYYFTNRRLPETLDEINTFPGAEEQIPLTCPASGQPYVYSPDGILLAEQRARVIIYDPTPAHYGGHRWAIRMEEPGDNQPMVTRVIALPESFFLLRPPG